MEQDLNSIIAILFIFIISLGVIFFFNVTVRYIGRITRWELFIIIIIMGFSLGYVVSLISYQQSLPEIRDLKRETDLQLISDGLATYFKAIGYDKKVFDTIPNCPQTQYIGTSANTINLVEPLEEYYLNSMPIDPFAKSIENSFYTICIKENLRIVLSAPKSELTDVISVIK
jgi:hypothetical protein